MVGVALERQQLSASLSVPDLRRLVLAAGHHACAIGREGGTPYIVGVPFQRCQLPSAVGVPHLGGIVVARGYHEPAIG